MFDIEAIMLPLMMLGVFWIIFSVFETWLRHRRVKLKFELQDKMLQKFNSADDLAKALGSEGGIRYLETLSLESSQPQQRILRAIQTGIVLSCLGVAFLAVGFFAREVSSEMRIAGSVVIALGIGFFLSGWVSHRLSQSWGLYASETSEPSE